MSKMYILNKTEQIKMFLYVMLHGLFESTCRSFKRFQQSFYTFAEGAVQVFQRSFYTFAEGAVQVFQQKSMNHAGQHLREMKQDPAHSLTSEFIQFTYVISNVPICKLWK